MDSAQRWRPVAIIPWIRHRGGFCMGLAPGWTRRGWSYPEWSYYLQQLRNDRQHLANNFPIMNSCNHDVMNSDSCDYDSLVGAAASNEISIYRGKQIQHVRCACIFGFFSLGSFSCEQKRGCLIDLCLIKWCCVALRYYGVLLIGDGSRWEMGEKHKSPLKCEIFSTDYLGETKTSRSRWLFVFIISRSVNFVNKNGRSFGYREGHMTKRYLSPFSFIFREEVKFETLLPRHSAFPSRHHHHRVYVE